MLSLIYIFSSLVLIAVSIPLIRRRVPPNPWCGFRTPKTLGSEAIWYEANAFAGRMLRRAGIVTLVVTFAAYLLPLSETTRALVDVSTLLTSVLWTTAASFVYLHKL